MFENEPMSCSNIQEVLSHRLVFELILSEVFQEKYDGRKFRNINARVDFLEDEEKFKKIKKHFENEENAKRF